jgi:hypothetical protein
MEQQIPTTIPDHPLVTAKTGQPHSDDSKKQGKEKKPDANLVSRVSPEQ